MPERTLRFTAAGLGGFIYEATQLLLPDWLRRTRLYTAIVAGLLRIAIELVGDASGILLKIRNMNLTLISVNSTKSNMQDDSQAGSKGGTHTD